MKWKERGLAVLLGGFITLLVLEMTLRLVGWGAQRLAPSGGRDGSTAYTVMCVGDSFTEGYWALKASETYPAQLERVIGERLGVGKVRVVNRGQSGQNTYQVLRRLDDDFDAVKPDAVVVLAGGANEWDLFSYHRYCEGDSWSSRVKDAIYRLRIFKLVKLLASDVAARREAPPASYDKSIFGLSYYSLRALHPLRQSSAESQEDYDRGLAYWNDAYQIRAADLGDAEACFRSVLKRDPQSMGAWLAIGWVGFLRHDMDATSRCFLEAYKANARRYPRRSARLATIRLMKTFQLCVSLNARLHPCLCAGLEALAQSDPDAKKDYESFVRATGKSDVYPSRATGNWIRSDLAKIIQKGKDRGAVVLLLNYPRYDPSSVPAWEETLGGVARDNGAAFVDERAVFDPMADRLSYFADDHSHPNAAGNQIMAEAVMNVLLPLMGEKGGGPKPSAAPR